MIEHYEIRKINKESVLILYLSYDYEFSSDFKGNTLVDRINNFIRVSKIKWKGNKIILVVGGIILGSLTLGKVYNQSKQIQKFDYVSNIVLNHYDEDNNEIGYSKIEVTTPIIKEEPVIKNEISTPPSPPIEEIKKEDISINTPVIEEKNYITIYRDNGNIENIELEEYIVGVVAAEMPAAFNIEALKAQSVAARTYALKAQKEGKKLTDNEKTQSYKDINELKELWGNNFDTYYEKIKKAVNVTKGQAIFYNNDYIEALYHSTSNGYTENSYEVFGHNYPYLTSVNSSWDINASSFLREKYFTPEEVNKLLGIDFSNESLIEILERTSSGRVSRIKINDNYYTGIELRNLLGLRSADFDITLENEKIKITTRGYGHGVGMSQYGANGMANNGKGYVEILKHYYPSTIIKTV